MISKTFPYPLMAGGRIRIFNLIKQLSIDHKITFVSFIDPQDLKYIDHFKQYCERVETITSPASTDKIGLIKKVWYKAGRVLQTLSLKPMAVRANFNESFDNKFRELLAEDSYDIVQVEFTWMAQYLTANMDKIKAAHTILVEHDIAYVASKREALAKTGVKKLLGYFEYLKMKRYETKAIKSFDTIVVMSDADKKTLTDEQPANNIRVIPNGVDVEYFRPVEMVRNKKPHIIFTGWMKHFPNVNGVLYFVQEIFPLIKKANPDAQFHVFGAYPTEAVKKLAKDKSIHIHGYVEDIRPFMWEGSVFVVPLKIGSGTRLKILEAMAAGIPVVTTSIGCEGLEVQDGENILIRDDPREFADQVSRLLLDKTRASQISINARKLVEFKYDWSNIAVMLDKVYSELGQKD